MASLCLAIAIIYLVLGLIFAVIYSILYSLLPEGTRRELEPKDTDAEGNLTWEAKDRLKLEYETFNSEIARRGEAFIISGTIFVTLSFLILAEASKVELTRHRIVLACASLAIYSLWLFLFAYTGVRLDRLSYTRIHSIEDLLKIEVHKYVKGLEKSKTHKLWIWFRRNFWAIVLVALSLTGFFVLLA